MSKSKSKKKKSNPNIQRGSNKNFKPVKQITPVVAEPENKVEQDVEEQVATSVEADEVIAPVDAQGNVVLTTDTDEEPVAEPVAKAEEKSNKERDNVKAKGKKPVKEKKKFGRRTK